MLRRAKAETSTWSINRDHHPPRVRLISKGPRLYHRRLSWRMGFLWAHEAAHRVEVFCANSMGIHTPNYIGVLIQDVRVKSAINVGRLFRTSKRNSTRYRPVIWFYGWAERIRWIKIKQLHCVETGLTSNRSGRDRLSVVTLLKIYTRSIIVHWFKDHWRNKCYNMMI